VAQFKFLIWLSYWYQQSDSFDFEWDNGNLNKSTAKHGVGLTEVESVFELKMAVPLGRQITPAVDEERLCIVGPSTDGRMLSIVFTLRDGRVRPISGRPASRKERGLYEEVSKAIKSL
jgi:uncharacterized DUF497 family protein